MCLHKYNVDTLLYMGRNVAPARTLPLATNKIGNSSSTWTPADFYDNDNTDSNTESNNI